uniref:lysophosphatidic acid receptor 1-like isoform X3 n=1 Tax=Myxine glutinosa TaxID=7769 RepID=UPI00358DF24C
MTSANITMDGTSAPSTVDTVCHRNEPITFFYNASKKPLTNEWTSELKLVMGLGIIVSIFTVMANMLVMVAIYRNRRFHFPIYYLMANLAAADFLAGLSYFYLAFNTGPETKNLTVNVWMFRQGLIDTSLTASVANLLAIAIERHITVFQMQLHSKMSVRRVVIIIAIIWIAAIFMGAIPGMGWNCICDIKSCSTMVPLYSTSYLTFWAVSNLFVFFVMLALYTHIFAYVRGRAARMAMHGAHLSLNSGHATMGLLKTVSIVLGKRPAHRDEHKPSDTRKYASAKICSEYVITKVHSLCAGHLEWLFCFWMYIVRHAMSFTTRSISLSWQWLTLP